MLQGLVNTFIPRPMMPDNIKTLVLPSQLNFPVVPPVTKPVRKSRSQRRKEKQARLVQLPELIPGEDDIVEDQALTTAANDVKPPNLTHRYIPKFDAENNTCTWVWVPYELDENGKEVYDFEFEHDKAWNAFYRENDKREALQQKWWDQNPQW